MDRCYEIIKIIINSKGYTTINKIADKLKYSNKTIRKDLEKVKEILDKYDLKLVKKPGVGISIDGDESKILDIANLLSDKKIIEPYSSDDRQNYILKKLFMANENLTIKNLADELYVNRVTIYNDLNEIEQWLKKYNLKISRKPNHGIKIIGCEEDWRNAAANMIISDKQKEKLSEPLKKHIAGRIDYGPLLELINLDYRKLEDILSEMESNLKFRFSDEAFTSLMIHVSIAIKRLKQNKDIKMSKDTVDSFKNTEEFIIAENMASKIESNFNVKFPEDEIAYIVLHILGAKIQGDNLNNIDLSLDEDENLDLEVVMAKEIISISERFLSIDLSNDKQLLNGLIIHLKPTINRIKYGLTLRNPMLNQIKENYPYIFGIAWMTSSVFEKYLGKKINEEEIGYIALHIGAAYERAQKPLKAIVVCSSGIGTSQLLAARLNRCFKMIDIKDIVSAGLINSKKYDNVDFIISTISIKSYKPIINISPLLTQNDIKKLDNFIKKLNSKKKWSIDTKLFDYKGFKTKKELLVSISKELLKSGYVNINFKYDLLKRENMSTTEVGNGISMPHGNPEDVNKSVWAVIRLKESLKWDESYVKIVFMICLTKKDVVKANIIFRNLYDNIDNKNFVKSLYNAHNEEELSHLLEGIYSAYK